jgi:hypothetical protein
MFIQPSKKVFNNRKIRWCLEKLEIQQVVLSCLNDSNVLLPKLPIFHSITRSKLKNTCLTTNSVRSISKVLRLSKYSLRNSIKLNNANYVKSIW